MSLQLRSRRLGTIPSYANLQHWEVLEDSQPIGCISQNLEAEILPEQAWFWSIAVGRTTARLTATTHGHAPSLDAAKAAFETNWEAMKSRAPSP